MAGATPAHIVRPHHRGARRRPRALRSRSLRRRTASRGHRPPRTSLWASSRPCRWRRSRGEQGCAVGGGGSWATPHLCFRAPSRSVHGCMERRQTHQEAALRRLGCTTRRQGPRVRSRVTTTEREHREAASRTTTTERQGGKAASRTTTTERRGGKVASRMTTTERRGREAASRLCGLPTPESMTFGPSLLRSTGE